MATTARRRAAPAPVQAPAPEPAVQAPAPVMVAPAPAVASRVFTFDIQEGLEIPANLPRAAGAQELPFKARFDGMKHGASFFVPTAYWTLPRDAGGRGVDPAKADAAYIRGKLRGAFNAWRDKDPSRANRALTLVPREAGDVDGLFTEPGFSAFMLIGAS